MQHAQLLVVNHALFFSDLALRREGASILPDYDAVIFDEAHTLEAVAGDHLGANVSNGSVEYRLNKLFNDRTNRGLLVHHQLAIRPRSEVLHCRQLADEFFADVDALLRRSGKTSLARRPRDRGQSAQPGVGRSWPGMLRNEALRLPETEQQDLTSAAERLKGLAQGIENWRTAADARHGALDRLVGQPPRPDAADAGHRPLGRRARCCGRSCSTKCRA